MRALRVLLLAAAFATGLYYVAWWTVPVVAALFAAVYRGPSAPVDAMLGAMVASIFLLAPRAIVPAFRTLLDQLGQIFPMPGIVVLCVGLLLAMTLAFTAARVTVGVVGTRREV